MRKIRHYWLNMLCAFVIASLIGTAVVVIDFSYRNACNLLNPRHTADMLPQAALLAKHGYGSLLFDFRAHGESEGEIVTYFTVFSGLPAFPFAPLTVVFAQRQTGLRISEARPIDDIPSIAPRPVFIIHSTDDDLIPIEQGLRLYEAAGKPETGARSGAGFILC